MMTLDTVVTVSIVIGAATYLYRKFARSQKSGGSGCASGGGCCGSHDHAAGNGCCSSKH